MKIDSEVQSKSKLLALALTALGLVAAMFAADPVRAGAGWGDTTNTKSDAAVTGTDKLGNRKVRTYYANSPQGLQLDAITGGARDTGVPLRKFVDALPGLNVPGGAGITLAAPDTLTYPGADYYEVAVVEYTQRMHSDLAKETTLRGYVQIDPVATDTAGGSASAPVSYLGLTFTSQAVPLFQVDGVTPVMISRPDGNGGFVQKQAYAWAKPDYLGATIVAFHGTPTRVKFYNGLPAGHGGLDANNVWHRNGDLFIPVDHTLFGGGDGQFQLAQGRDILCGDVLGGPNNVGNPLLSTCKGSVNADGSPNTPPGYVHVPAFEQYTENREELHLHGGDNPWLSDGHPHQWITPAADEINFKAAGKGNYARGDIAYNVPDMADAGPGAVTYYWPNGQSGRLMFYHDHATGLTRLNVYAGTASGYLLVDGDENGVMQAVLGTANAVEAEGIPLVIQEKTFVPKDIATEDAKWDATKWGQEGDLWFPHVYETNQDPLSADATNPVGRWDGASFFWPVFPQAYATPDGNYGTVSTTPEAFMDTPIVNGMAYPTMTVDPKPYRFRILSVANDRVLNLGLYVADSSFNNTTAPAPAGQTYAAPLTTNTEVAMVPFNSPNAQFGTTYACPDDGVSAPGTVAVGQAPNINGTITKWGWTESGVNSRGKILYNTSFPCAGGLLGTGWGQADNRLGGVPDPANIGPDIVRIGNEGGLFQAPVVIPATPMNYEYNKRSVTVLNVQERGLWLGPAERADIIVDFSNYAGKTLILYNDSGAPVPAGDPRIDYFTDDGDQTGAGGAPNTLPGYGPNTRTVMQIVVNAGTPAPLDMATLTTGLMKAYIATQSKPIVPTPEYAPLAAALTAQGSPSFDASAPYEHIYTGSIYLSTYNALQIPAATEAFKYTPAPVCTDRASCLLAMTAIRQGPAGGLATAVPGQPVNAYVESKAIQELFEADYGRMNATLGVELPFTDVTIQTTIPLAYVDPATETIAAGETQFWKITHNGVDTHPVHFHFINVQVINRVGWDGTIKTIPADEVGWKETVKMHPLEDVIVAVRAKTAPPTPFGMPHSYRQPAPNQLPSDNHGITQIDAATGAAPTTPYNNHPVDYGSEYVWHCHILGHEENDFMRPFIFKAGEVLAPAFNMLPATPGAAGITVMWNDPTPVPAVLTAYEPINSPTGFLGNPQNEIGFRVERASIVNGVVGAYAPVAAGLHAYNAITNAVNAPANATSYLDPVATNGSALTAPEQPTVVSQDATSVTLSLKPLTLISGAAGYDVYRNNVRIATNQAPGNFIDSGLAAGNTYSYFVVAVSDGASQFSYRVVAVTAAGDTVSSDTQTISGTAPGNSLPSPTLIVTMVPAVPTGITVTNPTVSSLQVNWTVLAAPQVTGYLVAMNGGTPGGATSPDVVQNLAANTTYTFTVAAVQGGVTGAASAPVSGLTLPAAPTALNTGAITANTVVLSWTAPVGGAAGYTVQGLPVGASAVVTGTSALVSGLAPNTTYTTFTVVATNASGVSAASNAVTFLTAPVAPTNLAVTAGSITSSSVTLSWTASLNGAATYTVQYSSNAGGSWTSLAPLAGTGTTVTGLLPSTGYLFQVYATNATGNSAASGQVGATTLVPATAPGVPVCCTATLPTTTGVTLNWSADPAGGTPASYTVQRSTTPTFTRGLQTTLNVIGTSLAFTGLNSNTLYYFHVLAVNSVGSSVYSATFSFQPPAPPVAPVAPTATASALSANPPTVTLAFAAPAAGVTYTVYQQSRTGGGAAWGAATSVATGATGTSLPISGLTVGLQYRYYLVAVSSVGTSANGGNSNTVTAQQLANAPVIAGATALPAAPRTNTRSVQLNWTLAPNGVTVTGIRVVRATGTALAGRLTTANLAAGATTLTVNGLVRNTTYTFQVRSVTASGVNGSTNVTVTTAP